MVQIYRFITLKIYKMCTLFHIIPTSLFPMVWFSKILKKLSSEHSRKWKLVLQLWDLPLTFHCSVAFSNFVQFFIVFGLLYFKNKMKWKKCASGFWICHLLATFWYSYLLKLVMEHFSFEIRYNYDFVEKMYSHTPYLIITFN